MKNKKLKTRRGWLNLKQKFIKPFHEEIDNNEKIAFANIKFSATHIMRSLGGSFLRNNLNPKIKDNFPLADTLLASYGIIISEDTKFEYENKKMSPKSAGILIHNIHHYMLTPLLEEESPILGWVFPLRTILMKKPNY